MSVLAPPRPPPAADEETLGALDALFEEARRRARRRRRRSIAVALLAGAAAAGAYAALGLGGDEGAAPARPAAETPHVDVGALDRVALRSGRLTLIDFAGGRAGPGNGGWYELKILDRTGRLRPFIRCPDDVTYCGIVEAADWSPNGRRLAFTVGAHGSLNPYIGLHLLDVSKGTDRRIADGSVCSLVVRSDLAWSPNGSQIAYTCTPAPGSRRAIAIVDLDGRARLLRTGTAGTDSSPTWSPTGDRIAFATKIAGAAPTVSTVGVNGGARVVLAKDATAPDWSPDGTTIAYRAGCGGIKLVTPQGRDVTPARGPLRCHAIGVAGTPVWLPGGERIAIGNRSGVYLVNKDGSGLRRISTHSGIGHHGGRPAWRP